jgi:hypothetical protein
MSKQRAFVKYTKSGRIIPGSLIITTNGGYPRDGPYHEVPTNLCCVAPIPPIDNRVAYNSSTGIDVCGGKGTAITIYLLQSCIDNPQIGCQVWPAETGTGTVANANYAINLPGGPGFITVAATGGESFVTAVTPC